MYLAVICFILPIQTSLTLLQYLNHYEASQPTRGTTITSQPVSRDAVLFVRLYSLRRQIISYIYFITTSFICFISTILIKLTVLLYLNHYEAS